MKKHRKRAIIMAYKVIILYQLYMPSYFLGTFTEYPYVEVPVSTIMGRSFKYNTKLKVSACACPG